MIRSVYFFCCPPGPPDNNAYLHNIVALAEGLQQMEISTFSDRNYWETERGYLLKQSDVDFRECDVVFIDAAFFDMGLSHLLPEDVFSRHRRYRLVYNDCSDGLITNGFREEVETVDVVLKSHYNRKYQYPANFIPWQFGLTNRIINQVNPLDFSARRRTFLVNFRVGHHLRSLAEDRVAPLFRAVLAEDDTVDRFDDTESMSALDYSYWCQTGRRHYPRYYQRLSEASACFCFGGHPEKFFYSQHTLFHRLLYSINWRLPIFSYDRVYQFDSWRFWESLVAGCCTVHVDFERYGIVLPVMPVNGEHYVGVDLDNTDRTRELVQQKSDILEVVGNQGRHWVLDNYSPTRVAERLVALFDN